MTDPNTKAYVQMPRPDPTRGQVTKSDTHANDLGVCLECDKRPAVKDYNNQGHYVCEPCDRILNDEFDREYR